ncbi:MAG TPA: hypothetical protein VFH29_03185 [Anaerolineales bacterium]|nr:hypothetical protein [Anaerolineales bacterium]
MTLHSLNNPAQQSSHRFRPSSTVLAWLGLVGYLILAKFVLTLLPPINVKVIASEFSWSTIGIVAGMGLIGALLAEPTGFMPAFDSRVTNRRRFLLPLLAGIGIGVLAVLIDIVTQGTKFIETQAGEASFNVYFPASLLVYTAGTVSVEALYRLLPFPLLFGLIAYVILRRRADSKVFTVLAVVLALFEPLTQGLGILFMKPTENPWIPFLTLFLPYFITSYPMNLIQAFLFRRRGLLASFSMRIGYYLVWHILYGSLIYPRWFA